MYVAVCILYFRTTFISLFPYLHRKNSIILPRIIAMYYCLVKRRRKTIHVCCLFIGLCLAFTLYYLILVVSLVVFSVLFFFLWLGLYLGMIYLIYLHAAEQLELLSIV